MAPTQPRTSGLWSPPTKAAVTLGIIMGLVLLILLNTALCRLLKKYVKRWIKDELVYDRYKYSNHCKCEQPYGHGPYPRRRLSSNPTIPSFPPSPVVESGSAPSRRLREPHYYPRQNPLAPPYYHGNERADAPYHAGDTQVEILHRTRHHGSPRAEHPKLSTLEQGSEMGFSWKAGDDRMECRTPYATSVPASAEAESPRGTTLMAGTVRSKESLQIRDI